jgi:hypothetical protein
MSEKNGNIKGAGPIGRLLAIPETIERSEYHGT